MPRVDTELAHFMVLDAAGVDALDTVVVHHADITTGYELLTITQTNEDGSIDVVCLTRGQLAELASQMKGH